MEKIIKNENADLNMNVQFLKGVGPKKVLLLNKMGIFTLRDLLEYYPRTYEDRTKLYKISEFEDGKNCLFIATIQDSIRVQRIRKNLVINSTFVYDDTDECKITWFNQNYIKTIIKKNSTYIFYGRAIVNNGYKSVESPQVFELCKLNKVKGIYPIYPITSGITHNYLFKLINDVYNIKPEFKDIFDKKFREKYNLAEINWAMKNIHFPKDFKSINLARNRIIFEELFLLQFALMSIKSRNLSISKGNKYFDVNIDEFLNIIPFKLTNAQNNVIEQIKKEFLSDKIINRLIQGDVGSGKTIVAAIAMYISVKNGYQATMMAPTTILATQHFEGLKTYFDKLGIKTELITSSTTKKNKKIIADKLLKNEIDILFGTHSLLEDNICFSNLGLVITDEQHRFGVNQRIKVINKGNSVDTLVMTATPIPRTLAIMLYGDLDISIIDEMPEGRIPVKTYVVDDTYEKRLVKFISNQVNRGHQVYVVCPLVEENETLDLKSAEYIYNKYKDEYFPNLNIGIIHGKMKNKEKDEIMNDFKNNKINILISTTVIEVGISVSNATLMIIENADRFRTCSSSSIKRKSWKR